MHLKNKIMCYSTKVCYNMKVDANSTRVLFDLVYRLFFYGKNLWFIEMLNVIVRVERKDGTDEKTDD